MRLLIAGGLGVILAGLALPAHAQEVEFPPTDCDELGEKQERIDFQITSCLRQARQLRIAHPRLASHSEDCGRPPDSGENADGTRGIATPVG